MIDLIEIIKDFTAHVSARASEGGARYYSVPFFHYGSDESIAIKVSELSDGRPVVTDCGTTYDYWEMNDIAPARYENRINAVMEKFGLTRDGKVFSMVINGVSPLFVRDSLSDFLSALCILAHIDL